jgi:hypothetical protein
MALKPIRVAISPFGHKVLHFGVSSTYTLRIALSKYLPRSRAAN